MSASTDAVPASDDSSRWPESSIITDEKVEGASVPAPPPPAQNHQGQPNGGIVAWLQVAAGWSVFFNTWGVMNTFGIFQTYYESGALFNESSSNIAWIGSIQALCMVSLGLVSGPLYDRGYLRALMVVGSFMIVFSFMMLSISKTFWQALLAQGFCCGIGGGLIFTPMLAVIPSYFSTKLGVAVGVAASGSSLGGVLYPIIFYNLVDKVGFGWTVRTIGFIALATLIFPVFFLRMRVKPVKPRAVLDLSAFTDWPFAFATLSIMLGFLGLYVTMFFISYFGAASGAASNEMAFYLIPILNAASVFGRTIPNAISDYTGALSLFAPAGIICGTLTLCLIAVTNLGGVVTIALFYGFFSGVYVALPPVIFVRLTADKSKIGTRIGMGFAFTSIAVLAGGPGAGSVLGSDEGDLHWHRLWIYGGIMTAAGGVMMVALRFYLTKGKFFVKA